MGTLKRFSYDNIVIHDPTAPDPVEGGGEGGGAGVFHAYFFDDSRYVCDEAGNRVQFDDLVKQDPTELPVFVMTMPTGTLFFFYLVYMESDAVCILSAQGSSASTAKILKQSGTGYAKMGTGPA